MKKIPLNFKGLFALVDEQDYARLSAYNWKWKSGDVRASARCLDGKFRSFAMHRMLKGFPPRGVAVLFKNGNPLDHRQENLIKVSGTHVNHIRDMKREGYSKFRGVTWNRQAKKWQAFIRTNYKYIHVALCDSEEEAARARDEAALKLIGTHVEFNFPRPEHQILALPRFEPVSIGPHVAASPNRTPRLMWSRRRGGNSQYHGVTRNKTKNRWVARVGALCYVGSFGTEEEAARAYDAKVKALGLEARLNFY